MRKPVVRSVKRRDWNKWNEKIRKRLRYAMLSYGYLKKYTELFPQSPTIVAFSGQQIMGWIFILNHNGENIVSFFTNKRYRRKGVATVLAEEAIKNFGSIAVIHWDKASKRTFQRLSERHYLRVRVYHWPTSMPTKCGCAYCNCH